jgi:hypothetical protein
MLGKASLNLLASLQGARNIGKIAAKTFTGKYGGMAAGAAWGAVHGLVSDNTSVVGGALTGAAIGGAIGRYGNFAYHSFNRGLAKNLSTGAAVSRAFSYTSRLAARDAHTVRMAANRGYGRVASTLKGWGIGAAPI